ncbi:MAG: TauD/TfdA family dioxygenase [Proteobacteria bacterium]|nr:TauD/TfdA family dioxygenase [Pseudomonadota bacterium]
MSLPFDLEPLAASHDVSFGAIVRNIQLAELDQSAFEQLHEAWLEYALLIFPAQFLSNSDQVAFAERFGELEFDLAPISNVRRDGSVREDDDADGVVQILKGNMGWHCDSTYMPVQARGAVFTAHVVPETGGETGWADLRAAYDALDEATQRRLEGLSACHSLYHSQKAAGESSCPGGDYRGYGFHGQEAPLRPLVKTHPETGRKSLLIGRHAYGIPGMSEAASTRLLEELLDFTCQPPRVYHHHWSAGDAVLWDNRCLLHRACPWDMTQPRVMYHARIKGDPITEYAAPVPA